MVFDFYTKKIKVFVSEVSEDVQFLKEHLIKVLNSAGMEVLCLSQPLIPDNQEMIDENRRLLAASDCTVHILGSNSHSGAISNGETSIIKYQLSEAQSRVKSEWRDFKIFIWHPNSIYDEDTDEENDNFISSVRQGIIQNMIYSNRDSAVSFVEDIRSVMYGGKPVDFDIEKTELFFIYNGLDSDTANDVISLVADVVNIKKLEIQLSIDVDYAELVTQQIKKSNLVVIYFKNTADWALPFVQQVWKKTGGASSATPILFIGDANNPLNAKIEFEAPKVTSLIVPHEIMPIEIKVQYDKLIEF